MSCSGPGARTKGDRETCRYYPGSKARVPHVYGYVYGVLSVLLPYRICQRSLVTLCLDCRVSPATFGSLFTGLSAKMTYYKAYIVLESYTLQKALSDACAQVPSPVYSHTISRGTAQHSRHKSDIQGGHTGHHTHAGDALWTQVHSESARGRLRSARLVRCSSQKAASATCERARADKKKKSEAGGGRGTVLAHWRGFYPSKVRFQPSEALQEQLVRASRAGQALSCAKARPMRPAISQCAFQPSSRVACPDDT